MNAAILLSSVAITVNILPQFQGKAVHDSWVSYGNYEGGNKGFRFLMLW